MENIMMEGKIMVNMTKRCSFCRRVVTETYTILDSETGIEVPVCKNCWEETWQ